MVAGIIIGLFIALVIVVLDKLAIFSWIYSMEKLVARYNYLISFSRGGRTNLWGKKIEKRLFENPQELTAFISTIGQHNHNNFNLYAILKKTSDEFGLLEKYYTCARTYEKENLASTIKSITHEKALQNDKILGLDFFTDLLFFTEVILPAVKEKFSKISDLKKLENARTISLEGYHTLIDEREIELLSEQLKNHIGIVSFLELFKEVGTESAPGKFLLKEYEGFLVALPHINSLQLLMDIDSWKDQLVPIRLYLEKASSDFLEEDIDEWLLHFKSDSEYIKIFAERMKILYAEAGIEVLAEKWKKYSEIPAIRIVIDRKMYAACRYEGAIDKISEIWAMLPPDSKTYNSFSNWVGMLNASGTLKILPKEKSGI